MIMLASGWIDHRLRGDGDGDQSRRPL